MFLNPMLLRCSCRRDEMSNCEDSAAQTHRRNKKNIKSEQNHATLMTDSILNHLQPGYLKVYGQSCIQLLPAD